MYSPKIKEELITPLYELSKARKVPMTKVVNKIIKEYLEKHGPKGNEVHNEAHHVGQNE